MRSPSKPEIRGNSPHEWPPSAARIPDDAALLARPSFEPARRDASRAYVTVRIQAMTPQLARIDGLLADLHRGVRCPGQPNRQHERTATALASRPGQLATNLLPDRPSSPTQVPRQRILRLADLGWRAMLRLKAGSPARHSPILQRHLAGLHRGHGRGASPSKPSRRVRSSHPPHQGGRAGRAGRAGSSADDSRAASTAYGFRTPSVLPPVNAASSVGVHPVFSAVSTTGASLARWAAVNRQAAAMAAKNSPTGPLSPRSSMGSASRKCAGGGRFYGWFPGRFGCNRRTPWLHQCCCARNRCRRPRGEGLAGAICAVVQSRGGAGRRMWV